METPPWEPPPLVAYRLNGQEIPLERGGPVRMVVPWAHGFKSIKWLQRIVLTNDYQANDTYALQNNDPESYLKTAAYIGKGPESFKAGEPVVVDGNGHGRAGRGSSGSSSGCGRQSQGRTENSPMTTRPGRRRSGSRAI